MNDSVWFVTIVFDGHVSFTSISANNLTEATSDTYDYIKEYFSSVDMWGAVNQELNLGNEDSSPVIVIFAPKLQATIIKG